MELTREQLTERIDTFIKARTIKIDGQVVIHINGLTTYLLVEELSKSEETYYESDDFRSQA